MGTLCRERKLRVAKKRVIGRYPKAFRKMAVERLKRSDNIVALSQASTSGLLRSASRAPAGRRTRTGMLID